MLWLGKCRHMSIKMITKHCLSQDPRRQVDTKNLSTTDWTRNETTGLMERDLTYDRFQDFVITTATIKVSQKHVSEEN